MENQQQTNPYGFRSEIFLLVLIIIGILVRVVVYFQNRSLFLDEGNLAQNIVIKSIPAFFQPLDIKQQAPPFFMILEKISYWLFGSNELALRLFPLLAGCLAVWLFYRLVRQVFTDGIYQWFPVFMLAFSPLLIRYSSEIKQYSTDVAAGLLLMVFCLKMASTKWKPKHFYSLAALGSLGIWFSMPLVFILFGIGIFYLFRIVNQKSYDQLGPWVIMVSNWLLSFTFYYFLLLKNGLGESSLLAHHQSFFFPLIPNNAMEFALAGQLFLSFFRLAVGYTTFAYILGVGLFLLGCYHLFKKDLSLFLLFILPISSCMVASWLELYTLMPRLILFLIPIFLILITKGIEWLWLKAPMYGKFIITGLLLAIAPLKDGYNYLFSKLEIAEIRTVLDQVVDQSKDGDVFYVHLEAIPAFVFYTKYHDKKADYPLSPAYLADWNEDAGLVPKEYPNDKRVWLIFSHQISDLAEQERIKNLTAAKSWGAQTEEIKVEGASAYLFLKDPS